MRANRIEDFLFCLLTEFEFYIVGVGASTTRMGRGINTYAKHVCRRRRDGGEHRSPAKILKETFLLLALFTGEEDGSGWRSHL